MQTPWRTADESQRGKTYDQQHCAVIRHLDHRIGSLEVGKDADFVIWNDLPLSSNSICEQTWIDGCKYFDIEEDRQLREQVAVQRTKLVQKILNKDKKARKDKDDTSREHTDPNQVVEPNQIGGPYW